MAYEGDPDRAAALTNRVHFLPIYATLPHASRGYAIVACRVPAHWYFLAIPFDAGWTRGHPDIKDPVVFLHARQTTGGRQRLVVVQAMLYFRGSPFATEATFCATTFDPDVAFGSRPVKTSQWIGSTLTALWHNDERWLRIFAGQPDPNDPSHFTIEYEADGKRGVIDGWLRESQVHANADEVVLKVR